ncbi:MAG: radical SAM protein [Bryobacteraceae bacterium]|nr:radical SAM protein [Bryobacteraceae bacterium]
MRRALLKLREAAVFARAMASPHHPVLVQIVPVRRCNLACAYCNEFDHSSAPVPTPVLLRRLDRLIELGASIITFSGGEPLLHPELDTLVRHVRRAGRMATIITNGYLLSPELIRRFNRAGLDYLQVSIDNVEPDDVSRKSLRVLERKLDWLARLARFEVTINCVLGAGVRRPADALLITRHARRLGFHSTLGLIHDSRGQAVPLDPESLRVFDEITRLHDSVYSFAHFDRFQRELARGRPAPWHCPAGGRFLYVCEDGLVHYCSQRRGSPGLPLEQYSLEDLIREGATPKRCADFCTISCVRQTAMLDEVRQRPSVALAELALRRGRTPPFLRFLYWLFFGHPLAPWLRRTLAMRLRSAGAP